tara:strand:- start:12 stop:236 length:225 start_codon:yes stop_codon:yes gene_type:complete
MYDFEVPQVHSVCVYQHLHLRVGREGPDEAYHREVEHPFVEPSDHHFRGSYHPVVAFPVALGVHHLALDSSHDK